MCEYLKCNIDIATRAKRWAYDFADLSQLEYNSIFMFTGVAFQQLEANDFTYEELEFSQNHLRIGSGCYGILRPLDTIKPYRLDYFTKLPDIDGDMRKYWRERITDVLLNELKKDDGVLVNLASNETFTAFDTKRLCKEAKVIDIQFKQFVGNELKTVPTVYAKQARGSVARFIIKNKIQNMDGLKSYTDMGMLYFDEMSDENVIVYLYEKNY